MNCLQMPTQTHLHQWQKQCFNPITYHMVVLCRMLHLLPLLRYYLPNLVPSNLNLPCHTDFSLGTILPSLLLMTATAHIIKMILPDTNEDIMPIRRACCPVFFKQQSYLVSAGWFLYMIFLLLFLQISIGEGNGLGLLCYRGSFE